MLHLITIRTAEQLSQLQVLGGLTPLDPQLYKLHAPDRHLVVWQEAGITGYCSLWWQQVPAYLDHRLGLIGHYAAQDTQSAVQLLDHACQQLAAQGCTFVVAPIDGNTWRHYRLITERGTEPPFFLEPDHPDSYCGQFRDAGFTVFAEYSSALNADLSQSDPRLERTAVRLQQIQIRMINMQQFAAELERIHKLSLISFSDNLLYTPIALSEFVAQYSQIEPCVDPNLVLLAEQNSDLVGFLFAVPDLLQAKRGEPIDTLVIKTVAVLPGRNYAGLGNLLVARIQSIAQQLGYRRAIHALMHSANSSSQLSRRYAQPMRRYGLFGKALAVQ